MKYKIMALLFIGFLWGAFTDAVAQDYEGVDPIATPISEPIVTPIADPIVYSPVPKEYRDTEE